MTALCAKAVHHGQVVSIVLDRQVGGGMGPVFKHLTINSLQLGE